MNPFLCTALVHRVKRGYSITNGVNIILSSKRIAAHLKEYAQTKERGRLFLILSTYLHARTVHKSYVVTNGQDYRLRTSCNMPLVLQALSGVAPNASTETCDVSDFIHSNTWLLRNTGHARHVRTAQACACTLEQGAWNEQLACALVEPDLRLGTYSVHSGSLSTVRVRPM